MKRTKTLMATVTTSLLLTGVAPGAESLASVFAQTAPAEADAWKTDPQVGKAADDIFAWLKGTASDAVKTNDDAQKQFPGSPGKFRIMTDLTGAFNRVVMETELDNLGDLDKRMQEYKSNKKARETMSGYTDMYFTGEREIFEVLD